MQLCRICLLPGDHTDPSACVEAQASVIKSLLAHVGEPGVCRGCGVPVTWVTHSNGKRTPYTSAGLNHFVNCPEAARFKKVRTTLLGSTSRGS